MIIFIYCLKKDGVVSYIMWPNFFDIFSSLKFVFCMLFRTRSDRQDSNIDCAWSDTSLTTFLLN